MNTNIAFLGLLFLLYRSGDINSTQLLLLIALTTSATCENSCGTQQTTNANSTALN